MNNLLFSYIIVLYCTCVLSIPHIAHFISNDSLSGLNSGCKHSTELFLHPHAKVPFCLGMNDIDLKNGQTITRLVETRGFLPTCRVMQLMLWMASSIESHSVLPRDAFIDIGANIGSCTIHMAALGFPVISVEPVKQHVDTILGSIAMNPSFHVEVLHMGISATEKISRVNFGHGWRNWGATAISEVSGNGTAEAELQMITTDQVISHRRVALMKIDCEGCELDALRGAVRSLKRVPMIKMELVQQSYESGNVTMSPGEIVQYLSDHHFDLYYDHWNEQQFYFGNHAREMYEIDLMFGSSKFKQVTNLTLLHACAHKILSEPITSATFNHKQFLRKTTDIIAIERSLSERMKAYFLH